MVRPEGLGKLKKKIDDLIETRTRDLPASYTIWNNNNALRDVMLHPRPRVTQSPAGQL
jgi:hypothetical protein